MLVGARHSAHSTESFHIAHAELSEVLWSMVLSLAIQMGVGNPALGFIIMFFLFAFWAGQCLDRSWAELLARLQTSHHQIHK